MPNSEIRLNSRGDEVRRLHEDLARLGISVPRSETDEGVFGVGTSAAVRQVQAAAGFTASAVVDAETRAAIDDALLLLAYPSPCVEGRLLTERGDPAADVAVEMFRRTPGGSVRQIASAVSDSNGFYRMEYPPLDGAHAVGATLELRLAGPSRRRRIPISAPKFVGARHEVLNLVVPATVALAPEPEFVRLSADVHRAIGGFGPLTRVVTGGGNDDPPVDGSDPLAAACRATGWDARLLALGGVAAHLSETTGLEHTATYALVRYGLPTGPDDLAAAGGDAVRTALTRARNDGVVDLSDDAIRTATNTFAAFATRKRLDRRPSGGLSTYGEFLDAAELDGSARPGEPRPKRDAFDRVVAEHAGDPARLWAAAKRAGIDDPQIRQLQTEAKLAALTGHNLPLSQLIARDVLRGGGDPSTAGLRTLVHADLHKAEQWRSRLDELAGGDPADSGFDARLRELVPPAFRSERMSGQDAADAYAEDLARQVRVSFPTTVVGRMVGAREIPLGREGDPFAEHVSAVIGRAESRGFSFSSTPLGPYLRTHGAELVDGLDERTATATLAEFERLQRLYQVTPSNDALAVLAKHGISSAQDILRFGRREFLEQIGKHFVRPDEVEVVLRRTELVAATAYTFFGAAQVSGQPQLYGTSPSAPRRDEIVQSLKKKFPTIEELFGEQDFCACEHCRSVLSPAAYLVDLLHYLDSERAGVRPLDVLLKRRPDLEHLPLTCENTNTALPLIDLANEIMEYRVAKGALDAGAVRDTGSAVTADLLAEPQYVEPLAYDVLAKDADGPRRYPLALPFDLWLESVRGYLGRTDTDLADLLDTFRRTDELFAPDSPSAGKPPYRRAEVFFERLGLSPAEVTILTDDREHAAWYRLYGYDDAETARPQLRNAKTLARRLGISYVQLADLVRTWFVNPNLDAVVQVHAIGLEVFDVLRCKGASGVAPFTPTELEDFTARLAAATARHGRDDFDAAAWLDDAWAGGRFNGVLVLSDSDPGCSFDHTRLRLIGTPDPDPANEATDTTLDAVLLRINVLVRLQRRLGRPLEELDTVLRALLPGGVDSLLPAGGQALPAGFGVALRTALLYLAHTAEIADRLGVPAGRRADLVTLWERMPTGGRNSTYARLFLSPRTGTPDPVFDHPAGDYLPESARLRLAAHHPAVEAALSMSAADVDAVLRAAGRDPATEILTLDTVSLLFRHALLARALRLPVRDLIALCELTGVGPFHVLYDAPATATTPRTTLPLPGGSKGAPLDRPLSGTAAFLDIVDDLRAAGMTVAELDYLLRHSFDPVGPYRADDTATLRLAIEVADGLRRLAADHTAPGDAASLTDDMVARELGLVLPADVAADANAMWQRQVVYTAAKSAVLVGDQISPATVEAFPELTVTYMPGNGVGTQQAAYRGVPVPDRIAQIVATVGAAQDTVLGELLERIVEQAEQELLPLGWLIRPDDVGPLFTPPPTPTADASPAARAQALQAHETGRRAHFADSIMPRIIAAARRRLVVTTISAAVAPQAAGVAPALLESLLTDPVLLAEPDGDTRRPLVDVFAEVSAGGLSVTATDKAGRPVAVPAEAGQDATTAGINGAARIVLDGYLQVPAAGAYTFALSAAGDGDIGELRLGDSPDPVVRATGTNPPAAPSQLTVELRPNTPYRFTLTAAAAGGMGGGAPGTLSGAVSVQVEGDTLPPGPLSRLTLRPAAPLQAFARAHTLLAKALTLLSRLALSERELRHIRRHSEDFAGFDLAALPTRTVSSADTAGSFRALRGLLGYVRLRTEMVGGADELVGVFELAHRTLPSTVAVSAAEARRIAVRDLCERVASLTRRDPATVKTVTDHLHFGVRVTPVDGAFRIGLPERRRLSFTQVQGLRRLWDALALVERLGIGAAAATGAATPQPDATTTHSLRDAVRARYDLDGWRSVARAVNDPLRRRRRDALVAHLLHALKLERVEELYEVLLLDPATEPVVQTTRIRQAIASVQLFVQRCLLNLEEEVSPAAIDAEQWEWKKRYRVWEANRKIFLFPENWLVPELRDDQTHLFTELIGALLQGDVTDQLAEDAFATYLRGLTAIARLEIVSVWGEQDPEAPERNVLHVIGRDHNAPRAYYYRRRSRREWTPWEPVGAQIDGDHVGAVIYRGRLHIFWITPLEMGKAAGSTASLQKQSQQEPAAQPLTTVDVQLHWTELVGGQWSPRASSDPLAITGPSSTRLDADQLVLYVTKEADESSVTINMVGAMPGLAWARVRFVSRNGRPEVVEGNQLFTADASYRGAVLSDGTGLGPDIAPALLAQIGIKAASDRIFKQRQLFDVTSQQNPVSVGVPSLADSSNLPVSPATFASYLLKPFFCAGERESLFGLPALTQRSFVEYQGSFGIPRTLAVDPAVRAGTIAVEAALPTKQLTLTTGTRVQAAADPIDASAMLSLSRSPDWTAVPDGVLTIGKVRVGAGGLRQR